MKSLTDVVSGSGLSGYAEIALVIFLVAFLGVVISLFVPSKQRTYEHLRQLPMDGDSPASTPLFREDRDSFPARSAGTRARNDRHA
jgi:cbb3-type cytochrome oxidase subunit 3